MARRKQRLCRICKKNPVWRGGDVKEPGWNYGQPLQQFRYRLWYVCPRTGLLKRVKLASRKRQTVKW